MKKKIRLIAVVAAFAAAWPHIALASSDRIKVEYLLEGSDKTETEYIYGGTRYYSEPAEQKVGYVFQGWYTDEKYQELFTDGTEVNSDTILYGRYIQITDADKPEITSAKLNTGTVGQEYSDSLTANGGSGAYHWNVSYGHLPSGITLSDNGILGGKAKESGTFIIGVTVTDDNGQSTAKEFFIRITDVPVIETASLPEAVVGQSYLFKMEALGGNGRITWEAYGLPEGITMDENGYLKGMAIENISKAYNVRIICQDALEHSVSQEYVLKIRKEAELEKARKSNEDLELDLLDTSEIVLNIGSLPDGQPGSIYTSVLHASGGTEPYTWYLAYGELPPGIELDQGGMLIGIPDVEGTYEIGLAVRDRAGNQSEVKPCQLRVGYYLFSEIQTAVAESGLYLISTQKETAFQSKQYEKQLSVYGGTEPYVWSIVEGKLPDGVEMTGSFLRGIPTTTGTFIFTLKVVDLSGKELETEFTIVVE